MQDKPRVLSSASSEERSRRLEQVRRLRESPLPDAELLYNLALYMNRPALSRLLFLQEIYQKIVPVHGSIFELGVRWGQNLALYQMLRGIYEPYNYNRLIVGFDSFTGLPSVDQKDSAQVQAGDYGVGDDYRPYLEAILDFHESESPLAHLKKYEIVQGDASQTVPAYLDERPHTIVALAYFDFDLYRPTRDALQALLPHLTKGSVLVFDELNCAQFPGETLALREILGLDRYALRRTPLNPLVSYLVVE